MTKLVYYISAYKEPENVTRLINALFDDSERFYIHFDKSMGSEKFNQFKEKIEQHTQTKNIQITSEVKSRWGTFGMVEPTLRAMNHFKDSEYNYFINLTGECYPLKPPSQIKEFFEKKDSGFMNYWKMPYEGWWQGGMNRINNRFFFIPKRTYPYVKALHIPRRRKNLPHNLQPYGGWSLFSLPKDIINYTLNFLNRNPAVTNFFKTTNFPSEMIFQTTLMNSPLKDRIINDNLRYVKFTGANPRYLTKTDLEKLRKSGKLFARKLNPSVNKEILDKIDKELLAK